MTIEAIIKHKHLCSWAACLAGEPFIKPTYSTETSNVNVTLTDLLTALLFCVLSKRLKDQEAD